MNDGWQKANFASSNTTCEMATPTRYEPKIRSYHISADPQQKADRHKKRFVRGSDDRCENRPANSGLAGGRG